MYGFTDSAPVVSGLLRMLAGGEDGGVPRTKALVPALSELLA